MGNCPSEFVCQENEKKVCFKNSLGEKVGVCIPIDDQGAINSIKNKEYSKVCPACPSAPPCPTPGYYFLGKDLGDLEDNPAVKDYLSNYLDTNRRYFCESEDLDNDARTVGIQFVSLGRAVDFGEDLLFDDYISNSRQYLDTVDDVEKEFFTGSIDFMEKHKAEFSTDDLLDIEKIGNFLKTVRDTACPTTSGTETYTGHTANRTSIMWMVVIILLFIILCN